MFSNLFGKKDEADEKDHLFKDRAFMTTAAKMNACARLAKDDEAYIFIGWFPETVKKFKVFFTENGINENRVVESKQLHASQLMSHKPVFIEHYPLHSKEEALVHNWEAKNIMVYSAMDEPLFRHFGSDKIIPMMKLMGMKESEVIEHALVSKSIIKGQQKIEEQVSLEQSANSQAEWMQRNLPAEKN